MKRTLVVTLLLSVAMASMLTPLQVQSADFWTTKRTTYTFSTGYFRVYCANNWDETAYLFGYLASITCERPATPDFPYQSTTQSAAVEQFAASIETATLIVCPCGHTMTHIRTGIVWMNPPESHAHDDEVVQWQEYTPYCNL